MSLQIFSTFAFLIVAIECNDNWWQHASFYQIYPRSFKDSDNDGVGDLRGVISKLEHLRDAGVTAAWLSPIYSSPQVDQGYDVSNFTEIHREYGTLDDFKQLIRKANELDIRIVMDFVPNHSSDQHDWFKKSESRAPGYEDYYVWSDGKDGGPPNNWLSNFKYSAWQYSDKRKQYYLHQFAVQQPDLNLRSPRVAQEMKDVLTYWLDLGVAGFRVDAVPHLFEDAALRDEPLSRDSSATPIDWNYLDHIYTKDLPETYDTVYEWRKHVQQYGRRHGGYERIILVEAYTSVEKTMAYYGTDLVDGAHFPFNFLLITDLHANATARDVVDAVQKWMRHMPKSRTPNWALGNHDNHRVATRFGADNVDGFNVLIAMLPGACITYNGEEIGMEDGAVRWEDGKDAAACSGEPADFARTSRDFARTPYHWDDSANAGFDGGAAPWLPVSDRYARNNLRAQKAPRVNSHYRVYKRSMELRRAKTLIGGEFQIVAVTDRSLAVMRWLPGGFLVFVFNLSGGDDAVDLSTSFESVPATIVVELASVRSAKRTGDAVSSKDVALGPHEALVLKGPQQ